MKNLCREKSGEFQDGMAKINQVISDSSCITDGLCKMKKASADMKEGSAANILRVNALMLKRNRLEQLSKRMQQLSKF